MTIDRVAMKELLEKGSDQDLLREMLAFVAARMMCASAPVIDPATPRSAPIRALLTTRAALA